MELLTLNDAIAHKVTRIEVIRIEFITRSLGTVEFTLVRQRLEPCVLSISEPGRVPLSLFLIHLSLEQRSIVDDCGHTIPFLEGIFHEGLTRITQLLC